MKKTALILLAVAAVAFGRVRQEAAPHAAAASASGRARGAAARAAAAAASRGAPQVDEYARLHAMSAEEIEKSGLLGEIYFDFDKAEIRDADRATLTKNADALKRFDFLRVTVEGHCDERGTVEYNLALGERRARGGLRLPGVARRARPTG